MNSPPSCIVSVLNQHRIEFAQMVVRAEYPMLKAIADGNTLDLSNRADMQVAARFFDLRAALNYRNGMDWVDLNPLLWRLIDKWQPPQQVLGAAPKTSPQNAELSD
jgi:hypothetical protein